MGLNGKKLEKNLTFKPLAPRIYNKIIQESIKQDIFQKWLVCKKKKHKLPQIGDEIAH